jgi:hypothetical protein
MGRQVYGGVLAVLFEGCRQRDADIGSKLAEEQERVIRMVD